MLTLGIDSSAAAASAAIVEDGKLLGEYYVNTKQTHSQTLLPMVQGLLENVGRSCSELDALAVSHGPGSFTGVRIGISCVKGMALPNDTPCVGISTLEAIAYGGIALEGAVLCAVMDARCNQVYHGLFQVEDAALRRLSEDCALAISDLETQVRQYGERLVLLGDGAALCHRTFASWGGAAGARGYPVPAGFFCGTAGRSSCQSWLYHDSRSFGPGLFAASQAERELKKRLSQKVQ